MTLRLGNFELFERLGQGGMAEVWDARHVQLGLRAAVKVVTPGVGQRGGMDEAFLTEARSHARLDHPSIVRLFDFGVVTDDDEPPGDVAPGAAYLAMQRADGTVRDLFPIAQFSNVASILRSVLEALAYAHARGVVHRDLKPENVLTFDSPQGRRYLLSDFGIAQARTSEEEGVSRGSLGASAGTPNYMPPEQLRGEWRDFGPWTDLYSLGCMAFELVTGHVPFSGKTVFQIARAQIEDPMPPLAARIAVPEGFDRWVSRLVQKDPGDRFRRAADARFCLEELCRGFVDVERGRPTLGGDVTTGGEDTLADTQQDTEVLARFGTDETLDELGVTGDSGPFLAAPSTRATGSVPPAPVMTPPPPERPDSHASDSRAAFSGLGLFGLRVPRLVGLEGPRQAVWDELLAAIREGEPRAVLVHAGRESPSAQFASWLAARAHATGAANVIRAFHTRAGGPHEGLAGVVEDVLGLWELDTAQTAHRTGEFLAAHVHPDILGADVAAITAVVPGAKRSDRSRREVHKSVARVLEAVAKERPLLLLVEEAQWGHDALSFARYLLGIDIPACIVVTLTDSELEEDGPARGAVTALSTMDRVHELSLPGYAREEQTALFDSLLSLDPATRNTLVEHTLGDSEFAHSLVADLIEAGALEMTDGAFRLAGHRDLPTSKRALYGSRIERILGRFAGEEADAAARALECAGILGLAPDPDEWRRLCQAVDASIPEPLPRFLAEAGLTRASGRRWFFADEAVVAALDERARAAGRWTSLNSAAAGLLRAHDRGTSTPPWARMARHHVAAQEWDQALEAMLEAVVAAGREGFKSPLLEARSKLLATMQVPEWDARQIDQLNLESIAAQRSGDVERSRHLCDAATRLARETGYSKGLSDALRRSGMDLLSQGDTEGGERALAEAERVAVAGGLIEQAASSAFGRAFALAGLGRTTEAIQSYENAIGAFEAIGEVNRAAYTRCYLATALLDEDRFADAERVAQKARSDSLADGAPANAATAANALAEVARFRGNYAAAREYYLEAQQWRELTGQHEAHVTDYNLALVKVGEGEWSDLPEKMEQLATEFARGGSELYRKCALAVRTAALAALGRAVDLNPAAPAVTGAHRDIAWVLEAAASAVAPTNSAAAALTALATEHYGLLGRVADVERIGAAQQ